MILPLWLLKFINYNNLYAMSDPIDYFKLVYLLTKQSFSDSILI
jgi:hypothetical protein